MNSACVPKWSAAVRLMVVGPTAEEPRRHYGGAMEAGKV